MRSGLAGETALYSLATVVSGMAFLAFLPIMSTVLEPGSIGEVGVLRIISEVLAGIVVLGLPTGIVRAWQDPGVDRRLLLLRALAMPVIPAVLLGAMLAVAGGLPVSALGLSSPGLMLHAFLLGVSAALVQIALAFHRADGRALPFFLMQSGRGAVSIALLFLLLGIGQTGVESFLEARWIPAAATALLAVVLVLPSARRGGFEPHGLLHFSLPLVPAGLALMVLSSADLLMLRMMRPDDLAQSGFYEWASNACLALTPLTLGFGMAWQKAVFSARAEGGRLAPLGRRALAFLASILALSMLLGTMAPEITSILGGRAYSQAAPVVSILAGAGALYGFYMVAQTGPMLSGRTWWIALVTVLGAAANIVFNARLIPAWGAAGAAVATLGTNLFMSMALFWAGRRSFPVSFLIVLPMALLSLTPPILAPLPVAARAGILVASTLSAVLLILSLRRSDRSEASGA